jgi:hypothetical protein
MSRLFNDMDRINLLRAWMDQTGVVCQTKERRFPNRRGLVGGLETAAPCRLLQEIFPDELHRAVKLEVGVFLFGKAVALVFRHKKPHRRALLL